IERVMRVNIDAIANFYTTNADSINIDGQAYRLRYLNQILYGSDPVDALAHQSSSVPVIIIRTDLGQRMALQVDMIAGSRIEVVVKPLGRQLSHIDGISAATIMGDGSVMLILDLVALMRNVSNIAKVAQQKANKTVKQAHKPVVLIVDDSVTVRKVTSRLLERNGYEAQVATDGIDALERLQEMLPEVIVLDIEMPRMDGFEVANHIRHNPRLKHIPIVMITSRTGEKHRERAFGIGVNEYMGKPFQEQMLLDTLARFTQQAKTD
ncbi:response regulator, partial [Salmonella enterica subsp. enterica serovar Enteritidis]|nr:response regulator [Salmonella enterica subsp. enterica serovar Enteritidis]